MTGGSACRSTSRPTLAPERPRVVASSTARRPGCSAPARCGEPPRRTTAAGARGRRAGSVPGRSPRSSDPGDRARPVAIRPSGLISSSQPSSTHHHDTVGAQGARPVEAAHVGSAASQVSQRSPTTAHSGTAQQALHQPAPGGGSGRSIARPRPRPAGRTRRASGPGRPGAGCRRRRRRSPRGTARAAATPAGRRPGCRRRASKKSSSGPVTATPEHAGPLLGQPPRRPRAGRRPRSSAVRLGSGHGSASRSTLPEVAGRQVVDGGERRHQRGGQRAAQRGAAAAEVELGAGRRAPGSRPGSGAPRRSVRTAAAAPATPGSPCSAASTSPSSIRRPPSLTWSSARPMNSRPSGSRRTRSPLR